MPKLNKFLRSIFRKKNANSGQTDQQANQNQGTSSYNTQGYQNQPTRDLNEGFYKPQDTGNKGTVADINLMVRSHFCLHKKRLFYDDNML